MPKATSRMVRVDRDWRGSWEVTLPQPVERVRCETLGEAKRVAQLYAAQRRPCELIVRDAYHRVLQHELVDGDRE
jgi:hypothetical protein